MSGQVERIVWAGVFMALLLSGVVMGLVNLRPYAIESGMRPPAPELSPDRTFDVEYYRAIDAYLADRLASRGLGTQARYVADYKFFGDSTSPLVHVGADDTLFYAPYQEPPCDAIEDFPGVVDPSPVGPDVRYAVIAPKSAIYPDRLADRNKPTPCVAQARTGLAEFMAADPLAVPIDTAISAAAVDGTEVFFRSDTHWSPEARAIVAEQVVDAFAPGQWDPTVTTGAEVTRRGDLRRLLGSSEPETMTGPEVDRSPVTEVAVEEAGGRELLLTRHTVSADAVVPGTTLIVGDSQMGFVLPLIDRYFEELHFINWVTLDLRPSTVVPEADRVFFESIEFEATDRFTGTSMAKVRDTLGI